MSSFIDIFDSLYSGHQPSQTFTMSNLLLGFFSILIKLLYKSVWYLELQYLEVPRCRTIFSVPSVIFGLFLIRYLEHSHEAFGNITINITLLLVTLLLSTSCNP